jgi:hypothetical protein
LRRPVATIRVTEAASAVVIFAYAGLEFGKGGFEPVDCHLDIGADTKRPQLAVKLAGKGAAGGVDLSNDVLARFGSRDDGDEHEGHKSEEERAHDVGGVLPQNLGLKVSRFPASSFRPHSSSGTRDREWR